MHRQAGLLLGRLHESHRVPEAVAEVSRVTSRVGRHLDQVGGLLTPAQRSLVRDCARRLAWLGPRVPAVASHGDFQPRNWLWDAASSRLGVIDWERAEPAAAVRDLVRLEYGPWDQRPDLREQFFAGYGRALTPGEDVMLFCHAVLDALSGLQWGLARRRPRPGPSPRPRGATGSGRGGVLGQLGSGHRPSRGLLRVGGAAPRQ